MRKRKATPVQQVMIGLMAVAVFFFLIWLVPEVTGVIDPADEDTFSEWVWDLPFIFVLIISSLSAFIGVLAVWAAGHFIEGYARRKDRPFEDE